jgi:hypothetical protein
MARGGNTSTTQPNDDLEFGKYSVVLDWALFSSSNQTRREAIRQNIIYLQSCTLAFNSVGPASKDFPHHTTRQNSSNGIHQVLPTIPHTQLSSAAISGFCFLPRIGRIKKMHNMSPPKILNCPLYFPDKCGRFVVHSMRLNQSTSIRTIDAGNNPPREPSFPRRVN